MRGALRSRRKTRRQTVFLTDWGKAQSKNRRNFSVRWRQTGAQIFRKPSRNGQNFFWLPKTRSTQEFKCTDGKCIIGLGVSQEIVDNYHSLDYENGKWMDIFAQKVPQFSKRNMYELQRKGTTVKVFARRFLRKMRITNQWQRRRTPRFGVELRKILAKKINLRENQSFNVYSIRN